VHTVRIIKNTIKKEKEERDKIFGGDPENGVKMGALLLWLTLVAVTGRGLTYGYCIGGKKVNKTTCLFVGNYLRATNS
jgi:hypothetical protein